jgi:nicotinamidase-related amidase
VVEPDRVDAFLTLDPSRIAVVLVDFQNDFCEPGAFGVDPPNNTANAATAHRANEFARAASAYGTKTIYTRQVVDLGQLDERRRRWEEDSALCRVGTPGAELFIDPIPGSLVIDKPRFDVWQSSAFTDALASFEIDGLVIGGVELQCCVLYAVLGAAERGYHYVVPQDLASGIDSCDNTSNRAVRDFLHHVHPSPSSSDLLDAWAARTQRA